MRNELIPPLLGYYTMAGGEAASTISIDVSGDTTLRQDEVTNNLGVANIIAISASTRRGLCRFDLSSISSLSVCVSAKLILYATSIIAGTINVYKISDANGDWIQGTKNRTQAGSGEPCWNAKAADGSGGVTTAWAGSAGMSTAGTDYVNTVIATFTTESNLTSNEAMEIVFNENGLAVLQDWFGDVTNNGFLITHSSVAAQSAHSLESLTPSYRPVLEITYTA